MAKSRRRGPYAAGDRRRAAIVEIATDRFAEAGIYRTSMAEIAEAAGLTGPGLTYHFPTKRHLLVAVADARLADLRARAAQWGAEPGPDGLGPLRGLLWLTSYIASRPHLIEIAVVTSAEASDPASPTHDLFADRYASIVEEQVDAFQAGVAAGLLKSDLDYAAIARECLAVSDGLQLQYLLSGGQVDLVAGVRRHLERLAPEISIAGTTLGDVAVASTDVIG